jgi:raffinose/stachyose/melibiose transport system substrate-binding protein
MKQHRIYRQVSSRLGKLFVLGVLGAGTSLAGAQSLDFWHIQSTGNGPQIIQQAVDRFIADNPGVSVEVVPMQNDPYKTRIRTAIGASDAPCIFPSWGGGPLYQYVQAGQVLDLTEHMNTDDYLSRFVPASLSNVTFDEKIYGVPVENTSVAVIWYNKAIFADLGLEPPTTFAELQSVITTLKDSGIAPFSLANKTKWTSSMYYMYLVDRLAGPELFASAANRTGASFTDEPFVQAGQLVQDLVNAGAFNEGFNGLDYDTGQGRMLLYGGRAAMELMGSWELSSFKTENPDFYANVGFFPFPAVDGGEGDPSNVVGTVGDNFYHISSTCENPDEAFELLTYLIDDESVEIRIADGTIPPVVGVAEKLEDPVLQELAGMIENAASVQLWYDQYLPPELGETHKDLMQALFGLEVTPEEAAERQEAATASFYGE